MLPTSRSFYAFAIPVSLLAGLGFSNSLHIPLGRWMNKQIKNITRPPPYQA